METYDKEALVGLADALVLSALAAEGRLDGPAPEARRRRAHARDVGAWAVLARTALEDLEDLHGAEGRALEALRSARRAGAADLVTAAAGLEAAVRTARLAQAGWGEV